MASREKESHRIASRLARSLPSNSGSAVVRDDGSARKVQIAALMTGPGEVAKPKETTAFQLNAGKSIEEQLQDAPDAEDSLREAGFSLDKKSPWGKSPTVAMQYVDPRFAGTWTESSVKTRQFTLADPADAEALDQLRTRAEPLTAPGFGRPDKDASGNTVNLPHGIVEEFTQTDFSPNVGSYVTVVAYREISYKSLVELL